MIRTRSYLSFGPFAISWFMALLSALALSPLAFHFGYGIAFLMVLTAPVMVYVVCNLSAAPSKLRGLFRNLKWWQVAWFLIFLSGLVFRVRDMYEIRDNLIDWWTAYRVTLISISAVILFGRGVHFRTAWHSYLRRGLVGLMATYALLGMISTFWSVNPPWTFYKSAELLVDVAMVAALLSSFNVTDDFRALFNWNWTLMAMLLGTVWVGLLFWPDAIRWDVGLLGFQINGVYPAIAANGVGDFGAILALVALNRALFLDRNRHFYAAICILGLLTLLLSYSRTPLVGFFFASLVSVFFASKRLLASICLLLVFSIPLSLIPSIREWLWLFWSRGQSEEALWTLTGRVKYWLPTLEIAGERLIGYGAYSGTRFFLPTKTNLAITSSVDNEWLEVLAGTGILGLFLLALTVILIWKQILRYIRRAGDHCAHGYLAIEAAAVLAYITFRSFFVTSFFVWHPPLTFLMILGYVEFLRGKVRICPRV